MREGLSLMTVISWASAESMYNNICHKEDAHLEIGWEGKIRKSLKIPTATIFSLGGTHRQWIMQDYFLKIHSFWLAFSHNNLWEDTIRGHSQQLYDEWGRKWDVTLVIYTHGPKGDIQCIVYTVYTLYIIHSWSQRCTLTYIGTTSTNILNLTF